MNLFQRLVESHPKLSDLVAAVNHQLGTGGVVQIRTTLVAQKKVLGREGLALLADGHDLHRLAAERPGLWLPTRDIRVVHDRKVTDVFVAELVDTLQASVAAFSTYKYHHSGTGVVAENQTDTALGTPKEDARVVGTQVEGASANIYKSVGTITYTGTWAITEHGLFNTAGAGGPPVVGGVLMDRTVFAAINVVATNQIEFTYSNTFTAGG